MIWVNETKGGGLVTFTSKEAALRNVSPHDVRIAVKYEEDEMSDAPERIWVDGNQDWDSGSWGLDKEFPADVEYVRADRIEQLVATNEALTAQVDLHNDRAEINLSSAITYRERAEAAEFERDALTAKVARLKGALTQIAEEASVPVHTWKNGINFKKMYEGWRKIATKRIDIARAALAAVSETHKIKSSKAAPPYGLEGEGHE
ncbi:hypothetical protein UFOVP343_39 [uncultured Caudovirales phage]|uniref:Uncharacterized protein n=1 Tax=uncultured Caudovirales phage TaxID=2100421 RepID=A0A6J5M0N8_9CAUD|nr:hypothetical protein UFOVP343_39 [uncultured Caudovirales phage]